MTPMIDSCDALADAVRDGGHGYHFNAYCPQCGDPLTHAGSLPATKYRSGAAVDCARCRLTFGLEVTLRLIRRNPRRRPPQQVSPPSR